MITKRTNLNLLKSLFAGFLLAMVMTGPAHAWWNPDWTIRKKITIDTTDKGAGIADPVGTTPVLIRLQDDFQFAAAKDDGGDIRFVAADDKTVLPYHIEKYDSLMNEAFIWVKVPDVKPGAQITIWLYYGNPKVERAEDAKGTYDPDTALVYHFGEKGAPAGDSTSNGNNSQNPAISVDGSMIGAGARLDGHTIVTIPATDSLKWIDGGTFTWSAWIKPSVLQPGGVIFSRRDGAASLLIGVDNGAPYVEVSGQRSAAGAPIAVNSWHHLAVVGDGSKITLYLDGVVYGTLAASVPAMNSPLLLGTDGQAGSTNGFNGELDELEISKVARPAGFIKLAAIGQGADGATKLLSMGQDEQMTNWLSSLGSGTLGVLIRSLTPDGWTVIGILAVMAVISWWVMFNKASYLGSIKKGNDLFMREWKQISLDLTVLDHGDAENIKTLGGRIDKKGQKAMRQASVYRIYHIGAEEIRHRFAGSPNGSTKVLSAQSIQAIRASLDGGLVRELQKLNNLMVLLTIAISGGPFLGLLGTVVGVMITFAAIAAAGDVNVNAIAPGIAAALLATVAGLAVAIPSLFGYNYLTIQIKNASSDMHVFVDEFVTKMAEFYRPRSDSEIVELSIH
jgi:biopolymer transport protein ExbB